MVHYEVVADNISRTAHPLPQTILLELLPSNAEVPAVGRELEDREKGSSLVSVQENTREEGDALAAWSRNTNLKNTAHCYALVYCYFWTCLTMLELHDNATNKLLCKFPHHMKLIKWAKHI